MSKFVSYRDAMNFLADRYSLSTDSAGILYQCSACPDWDDDDFLGYDFTDDIATVYGETEC